MKNKKCPLFNICGGCQFDFTDENYRVEKLKKLPKMEFTHNAIWDGSPLTAGEGAGRGIAVPLWLEGCPQGRGVAIDNKNKTQKGTTTMNNDFLRDLVMAGVKWELTDETVGFVAESAPATPRVRTVSNNVVPPISPVSTMSIETVRAMAERPTTTAVLTRMIDEFNHPLRAGVSNVVVPHIAPNPNGVLVITDIPSSEDDATGRILSGPAGELFDKMIGAIGMSRENVSISPILFWRTPGGRTPSRLELDLGRPFLNRLIELLEPRVIITLGTLAAAEIAGIDLMRGHGAETAGPGGARVFSI